MTSNTSLLRLRQTLQHIVNYHSPNPHHSVMVSLPPTINNPSRILRAWLKSNRIKHRTDLTRGVMVFGQQLTLTLDKEARRRLFKA